MEILVRLPGDSILPVTASSSASIATLKARVQLSAGVPAPLQELSVQGKTLRDQDRVAACTQEVTVRISPVSELLLRLTVKETSGMLYQVRVRSSDAVGAVKKRIQELRGIEAQQQRLYAEKKLLEDCQTVSGVYQPGKFEWELLQPTEFYLTVTNANGHSYQVTAASDHRVCRVVEKLREFDGFDCRGQTFKYENREISVTSSFRELGITQDKTLVCDAPDFWVWAVELSISRQKLPLNPSDSLSKQVAVSTAGHQAPQWVMHRGKVLNPSATAEQSRLPSGAVLLCGDLLVHVRSFNAEKFDIVLSSYFYVDSLKRELVKRLHRNTFKLVLRGTELSEKRTFKEYGLASEATIELVEPTDNYVWVECAEDTIAVPFSGRLCNALSQFHAATGRALHTVLRNRELPSRSSGGVIQLDRLKVRIQACGNGDNSVLSENVPRDQLLLKPVAPEFDTTEIENTPCSSLDQGLGTERRLLGFRFADRAVSYLAYNPSELVSALKTQLQHKQDIELLYKETRLENEKRIGDYRIEETDFIEVCRSGELIVWTHQPKERLFVSISSSAQRVLDLLVLCRKLLSEPVELFFNGLLSDGRTLLESAEISTGCCVHAIPLSSYTSVVRISPYPNRFIFVQQLNGGRLLLYFDHCNTWSSFLGCLNHIFDISAYSLVFEDRLLTQHRFSRLSNGSVVHLFGASEAVLLRGHGGVLSPALVAATATVRHVREAVNLHPDSMLVCCQSAVRNRLCEDAPISKLPHNCVIDCIRSNEQVFRVTNSHGQEMFINLTSEENTVRDLAAALRKVECDAALSSCSGMLCKPEQRISRKDYLYLIPQQVMIKAVLQTSEKSSAVFSLIESDSVDTLRKRIAETWKLQPTSFRMLHGTQFLNDTATLSTLNIGDNIVKVVLHTDLLLIIHSEKITKIIVHPRTRFSKFTKLGFKAFSFHGAIVNGDDRVCDLSSASVTSVYGIKKSERLIRMSSRGRSHSQQAIVSEMGICTSVFHSNFGVRVHASNPVLWTGELSKSLTLGEYKMANNSTLFLLLKPRKNEVNLQCYGTRFQSKTFQITYPYSSTVAELAASLESCLCLKAVRIAVAGEIAQEHTTLQHCQIDCGEIVSILAEQEILLKVQHADDQVSFPVSRATSGKEVKVLICDLLDIPVEMQALSYCGAEFEDGMQIASIAEHHSVITFALRVRPGLIAIHSASGPVAVAVSSTTVTSLQLKSALPAKLGDGQLWLNEREMSDTELIAVREIGTKSSLALLTESDIRLNIQSSFQTYTLYMKKSDMVRTAMKKLQHKVGLHYSRLELVGSMEVAGDQDLWTTGSSSSCVLSYRCYRC